MQALSASCQLQVLSAHVTEIPWVRKSGTPRNPRISAGKVSAGHSSSTTCCATNRNGPQFGSWPFCHAGTASPLERIELQPTMLQKNKPHDLKFNLHGEAIRISTHTCSLPRPHTCFICGILPCQQWWANFGSG